MYLLISFRFPLLHNATQPQYKTDSTIHALNTAFGYFIHTNSLHWTKRFVNFFLQKIRTSTLVRNIQSKSK